MGCRAVGWAGGGGRAGAGARAGGLGGEWGGGGGGGGGSLPLLRARMTTVPTLPAMCCLVRMGGRFQLSLVHINMLCKGCHISLDFMLEALFE